MKLFKKHLFTATLIIISLFLNTGRYASAQFAVTAPDVTAAIATQTVKQEGNFWTNFWKNALNSARDIAEKVVIKGVIRSYLIQYAQYAATTIVTGERGQEPLFPRQQFNEQLRSAAYQELGDLAQQSIANIADGFDICKPFNANLEFMLKYQPVKFTLPFKCNDPANANDPQCQEYKAVDSCDISPFQQLYSQLFDPATKDTGFAFNNPRLINKLADFAQTNPLARVNARVGVEKISKICSAGPRANTECMQDADCLRGVNISCVQPNADGKFVCQVTGIDDASTKECTQGDPEPCKQLAISRGYKCVDATFNLGDASLYSNPDDPFNSKLTRSPLVGVATGVSALYTKGGVQTEAGAAFTALVRTEENAAKGEQLRLREATASRAYTTTAPSNQAGTQKLAPEDVTQGQLRQAQDNSMAGILQPFGNLAADVIGAFTNTLATQLMNRLFNGAGLNPSLPGFPGAPTPGSNSRGTGISSAAAIEFANLFKAADVQFNQGQVEILDDMITCPQDPKLRGINNCVITPQFRQAIDQGLTVQEAINKNLLSGTAVLGYVTQSGTTPTLQEGFSYRNLLILQKYRIIPRSWVLAADYIRENSLFRRAGVPPLTIKYLMDQWDNEQSVFYRMVDPNWPLGAPGMMCNLYGYGDIVQNSIVTRENLDQVVPEQTGGNQTVKKVGYAPRQEITRAKYCADERTCVKEREDGTCLYYGYCTKEKQIWRLEGQACPFEYDSCQAFIAPDGKEVAYLTNSLGGTNICNSQNVGCAVYLSPLDGGELPTKAEMGSFSSSTMGDVKGEIAIGGNGRKFALRHFSAAVQMCSPASEGCTELIPQIQSNGTRVTIPEGPDAEFGKLLERVRVTNASLFCENKNPAVGGKDAFVGCTGFTPDEGGNMIAAVISSTDQCNASCVGYDTFDELPTNIGAGIVDSGQVLIDIIPNTAQQCSVAEVGCDQFTNVRTEEVVNFRTAQACTTVSLAGNSARTYFTWQGGSQQGLQIRRWNLLASNNVTNFSIGNDVGPCTNFDQATKRCADAAATGPNATNAPSSGPYNPKSNVGACSAKVAQGSYVINGEERIGQPPIELLSRATNIIPPNPDCKEFFTSSGAVFYALASRVIVVDDSCREFRRTIDQKIYSILPSASQTCDAPGCRAYRGNTGFARTTTLPVITFPKDNSPQNNSGDDSGSPTSNTPPLSLRDWDSIYENTVLSLSSETLAPRAADDRSLRVKGIDRHSVIYKGSKAQNLIPTDQGAVLSAYVKVNVAPNTNLPTTTLRAGLIAPEFLRSNSLEKFLVLGTQTVSTGDWRLINIELKLTPATRDLVSNSFVGLVADSGESMLIDNVTIVSSSDRYLVKNTWRQPVDARGNFLCGESDLGCRAYTSKAGTKRNLSRFSTLCPVDFIGCQAFIDTKNSTAIRPKPIQNPYGPLTNKGELTGYSLELPDDEIVYRVYNPEIQGLVCDGNAVGCTRFGKVEFDENDVVKDIKKIFILDRPDVYVEGSNPILCGAGAVGCIRLQGNPSRGSKDTFAFDPMNRLCEYDSSINDWVLSKEAGPNSGKPCKIEVYNENGTRLQRRTDGRQLADGYVVDDTTNTATPDFTIKKPKNAYVKKCEANFSSCRLFTDPNVSFAGQSGCVLPEDMRYYQLSFRREMNISPLQSQQLSNSLCQAYSFLDTSVSSQGCEAGENSELGCIAFGRKPDPSKDPVDFCADRFDNNADNLTDIKNTSTDGSGSDGTTCGDDGVDRDLDRRHLIALNNGTDGRGRVILARQNPANPADNGKEFTNSSVRVLKVRKDRICAESLVSEETVSVPNTGGGYDQVRLSFATCRQQSATDICVKGGRFASLRGPFAVGTNGIFTKNYANFPYPTNRDDGNLSVNIVNTASGANHTTPTSNNQRNFDVLTKRLVFDPTDSLEFSEFRNQSGMSQAGVRIRACSNDPLRRCKENRDCGGGNNTCSASDQSEFGGYVHTGLLRTIGQPRLNKNGSFENIPGFESFKLAFFEVGHPDQNKSANRDSTQPNRLSLPLSDPALLKSIGVGRDLGTLELRNYTTGLAFENIFNGDNVLFASLSRDSVAPPHSGAPPQPQVPGICVSNNRQPCNSSDECRPYGKECMFKGLICANDRRYDLQCTCRTSSDCETASCGPKKLNQFLCPGLNGNDPCESLLSNNAPQCDHLRHEPERFNNCVYPSGTNNSSNFVCRTEGSLPVYCRLEVYNDPLPYSCVDRGLGLDSVCDFPTPKYCSTDESCPSGYSCQFFESQPKYTSIVSFGESDGAGADGSINQGNWFRVNEGDEIAFSAKALVSKGTISVLPECYTTAGPSIRPATGRGAPAELRSTVIWGPIQGNDPERDPCTKSSADPFNVSGCSANVTRNTLSAIPLVWQDIYSVFRAKDKGFCRFRVFRVEGDGLPRQDVEVAFDEVSVGAVLANEARITRNTSGPINDFRYLQSRKETIPSHTVFPGPTCRLYPTENATSCTFKDRESQVYSGLYGFCMIPDPENRTRCLQWYPVDQVRGESSVFEIAGSSRLYTRAYTDRNNLAYCIEAKAFPIIGSEQITNFNLTVHQNLDHPDDSDKGCSLGIFYLSKEVRIVTLPTPIPIQEVLGGDKALYLEVVAQYRGLNEVDTRTIKKDLAYPVGSTTFGFIHGYHNGTQYRVHSLGNDLFKLGHVVLDKNYFTTCAHLNRNATNPNDGVNVDLDCRVIFGYGGLCSSNPLTASVLGVVRPIVYGDYIRELEIILDGRSGIGGDKKPYLQQLFNGNTEVKFSFIRLPPEPPENNRPFTNFPTLTDPSNPSNSSIRIPLPGNPICTRIAKVVDQNGNYVGRETQLRGLSTNSSLLISSSNFYDPKVTNYDPKVTNDPNLSGQFIPYMSFFTELESQSQDFRKGKTVALDKPFGAISGSLPDLSDPNLNLVNKPVELQLHSTSTQGIGNASYSYYFPTQQFFSSFTNNNANNGPVCVFQGKDYVLNSNLTPPTFEQSINKRRVAMPSSNQTDFTEPQICVGIGGLVSEGKNGRIIGLQPSGLPINTNEVAAERYLTSLFPYVKEIYEWNERDKKYSKNTSLNIDCRSATNNNKCRGYADTSFLSTDEQRLERHGVKIRDITVNDFDYGGDNKVQQPDYKATVGVPIVLSFTVEGNPDQMPIRRIRVYWGDGESTIVPGVNNVGNGTRVSMTYTYGRTGFFPIRIDAIDQWCWTTTKFNPGNREDCHLQSIYTIDEQRRDLLDELPGVRIRSSRELEVVPERGE